MGLRNIHTRVVILSLVVSRVPAPYAAKDETRLSAVPSLENKPQKCILGLAPLLFL